MPNLAVRISTIACPTEAEGPGKRWAIWFQGCSIRCPGCCNPHLFTKDGGILRTTDSLKSELDKAIIKHSIEGITLLGGEPTEQLEAATELAEHAQLIGLTVLAFTGNKIEHLQEQPAAKRFLDKVDMLVDGPFDASKPETRRRWIGSTNQRLHFLSDRIPRHDPRWDLSNTIEITVRHGQVVINGFPLAGHRYPIGITENSHGKNIP